MYNKKSNRTADFGNIAFNFLMEAENEKQEI